MSVWLNINIYFNFFLYLICSDYKTVCVYFVVSPACLCNKLDTTLLRLNLRLLLIWFLVDEDRSTQFLSSSTARFHRSLKVWSSHVDCLRICSQTHIQVTLLLERLKQTHCERKTHLCSWIKSGRTTSLYIKESDQSCETTDVDSEEMRVWMVK